MSESLQTMFLMNDRKIISFNPKDLKNHPLSKELFKDLSTEDYDNLKADIEERGIQDALHVAKRDESYVIISGHQRKRVGIDLGINVPCIIRDDLKEDWQIEEALIKDNLLRRHLNDYQKVRCGLELEPIEKLKAKKRQVELAGTRPKKELDLKESFPKGIKDTKKEKGQTRDSVAKDVGFGSGRQYEKAKKVYKDAPDNIKEKWQAGKITTHRAYMLVNKIDKVKAREKEKVETPELPTGKFNVIYADPPWKYDFSVDTARSIEAHYPSMELEEICNLDIPDTENAILFLWATAPKLREALDVIKSWGYQYKTNAVWVKDKIGMGYYFRNQHELLLVATKGDIHPPPPKNRGASVINSPRGKHSKKPGDVYKVIEEMYPDARYLELFARETRERWKSWGSDIED